MCVALPSSFSSSSSSTFCVALLTEPNTLASSYAALLHVHPGLSILCANTVLSRTLPVPSFLALPTFYYRLVWRPRSNRCSLVPLTQYALWAAGSRSVARGMSRPRFSECRALSIPPHCGVLDVSTSSYPRWIIHPNVTILYNI
jgi:hypothetical protein